jgi:hypothetical protein
MDYQSAYAKERLTGRGYCALTATPTQYIDLGNVTMFEVDFGIKRKEHFASRRGVLVMDRYDAYAAMAKWMIDLDEFVTPTLPFMWAGSANTNFSQSTATAATFAFTSKKGVWFDVGKYGLNNASLTTPASKTEGITADYLIDRGAGKVYIPLGSTIADSTACVVTYDAPALTYDSIAALSILNRNAIIELHGEDDSQAGKGAGTDAIPPSRYIFSFPGILSVEKSGQFKPEDYRAAQLILTLTSPMTVKRLTI